MKNIFADIPKNLRDELSEIIFQTASFRIERIVSKGHCSPKGFWYDQDESEWVLLLKGRAVLRLEDESITLKCGDYIHIERHRRHRLEWTDPEQETVWLAIHHELNKNDG